MKNLSNKKKRCIDEGAMDGGALDGRHGWSSKQDTHTDFCDTIFIPDSNENRKRLHLVSTTPPFFRNVEMGGLAPQRL